MTHETLGLVLAAQVRAIAEALFHDGDSVPKTRLDWLVREWANFSAHAGMKTRIGFRGALISLELLPLFVIGVPLPMSLLSLERRTRYLEKVEKSNRAFLVTALKAPLSMLYLSKKMSSAARSTTARVCWGTTPSATLALA